MVCTRQYTHTRRRRTNTSLSLQRGRERCWVFVLLLLVFNELESRKQPKSSDSSQRGCREAGNETLKLLSPAHALTGGGILNMQMCDPGVIYFFHLFFLQSLK
ncbi:hypothetical protein FQA47_018098 [Oryzias melastigma]|uniref:Uncharacterized protein n=1 Tax=Oryzias melastigma TaxID=30732 RepID=A0A834CGG5_ORYME|nr:hypothetical protein FQA47_018098 [Oryzias melastigma]